MDLDEARAELLDKQATVRAQIAQLTKPVEAGSTIGFGKRIGDGTQQAISQMEEASSAQHLTHLLWAVERALAKIDAGTYGRCDTCGSSIDEFRLGFRPWSVTCVEHADMAKRPL